MNWSPLLGIHTLVCETFIINTVNIYGNLLQYLALFCGKRFILLYYS